MDLNKTVQKYFKTIRHFKDRFVLDNLLAEVFYNVNNVNANYLVNNSTVDCKYFVFLQDFSFRLKPNQVKIMYS